MQRKVRLCRNILELLSIYYSDSICIRRKQMARGQRRTIEEKIADKEEIIRALQTRIKSEKEELEGLYQEKREKDLAKLAEVLKTSGLSPDDAAVILQEHMNGRQEKTA